jgi:hypothetical protein
MFFVVLKIKSDWYSLKSHIGIKLVFGLVKMALRKIAWKALTKLDVEM